MNAKLKKKWLAALRSGEYRQTKSVLYSDFDNAYCCLGVLADIQGCPLERLSDKAEETLPRGYNAGLSHEMRLTLAGMNDGGKSFSQIADYIEDRL